MPYDAVALQTHSLNKIPSEILAEIFLYCLPFVPSLTPNVAPRVFTGVCRKWRQAALERAELWTVIHLPSPSERIGRHHVEAVKLFLERSATCPLHIDLGLIFGTLPWRVPKRHLELVEEVVRLLVPHAGRIRTLDHIIPSFFMRNLPLHVLKQLKVLTFCDREEVLNRIASDGEGLPQVIERLGIHHASLNLPDIQLPTSIEELVIEEPIGRARLSVSLSLHLLSNLPFLKICHLDITRSREMALPDSTSSSLEMTTLKELEVTWRGASVDIGVLFNTLVFPQLTTLILRGVGTAIIPWEDLTSSIERSKPPLQSLTVIGNGTVPPVFIESLIVCNDLASLTLSGLTLTSDFLNTLTLNTRSRTLLPALAYLCFDGCRFESFSHLLDMLRSRGCELPPEKRLDYFYISAEDLTNEENEELQRCQVGNLDVRRLGL